MAKLSDLADELRTAGPASAALKLVRSAAYRLALRPYDARFDKMLGGETEIKVSPTILKAAGPNALFGLEYAPTPGLLFHSMLRSLKINYGDFTFIDIGSGKGRILCLSSLYPFRETIGIEFSESLSERAASLCGHLLSTNAPKCRNIRPLCVDATQFEFPNSPTVIYMYNPFLEPVFSRVLENIRLHVLSARQKLYLIYYNPHYSSLVERAQVFRRIEPAPIARAVHAIASPHDVAIFEAN